MLYSIDAQDEEKLHQELKILDRFFTDGLRPFYYFGTSY